MTSAEGIRKLGFRRWYERQLIESHAYLVTGFLSLILAIACMEEFSVHAPLWRTLSMIVAIACAGGLCLAAVNRYKVVLERAESLAVQSVCGQCGVYGMLKLVASRLAAANPDIGEDEREIMTVECRKCGHRWSMSPTDLAT